VNEYLEKFLETNRQIITNVFMITSGIREKTAYVFMSDKCEQPSFNLLAKSANDLNNSIDVVLMPYWHGSADELREVVGEGVAV